MYVVTCDECGDDLEFPFRSVDARADWITMHTGGTEHYSYKLFEAEGFNKPHRNESPFRSGP